MLERFTVDRPLGIFGGAIAAGLVQGGMLFGILESDAGALMPLGGVRPPWPILLFGLLFLNFVIGLATGIIFALLDILRATVAGPKITATCGHSDVPPATAESLLAEYLANDRAEACPSPEWQRGGGSSR